MLSSDDVRRRMAEAAGLAVQLLPLTALSGAAAADADGTVWAVPAAGAGDEVAAVAAHPEQLDALAAQLAPAAAAGASATRFAVVGAAGVGKSTLARAALQRARARFRHGWALDGASETSLLAGLDQVARDLRLGRENPARVAAAVRARLGLPDAVGWVLLVEGVAPAGPFARHLPDLLPNVGGCIVVTSRAPAATWSTDDGWSVLALAPLARPEALRLLSALAPAAGSDTDSLAAAADLLGGLPIALAHAAGYVARRRTTWRQYTIALAEQAAAAVRQRARDAVPAAQLAVAALVEDHPLLLRPMVQLLQVVHPGGCPRALLLAAYASAEGASAPGPEALATLASAGLVAATGLAVAVHPLVQAAMGAVAPCDEERAAALCAHLNALVYDGFTGDYALMRQLLVQYDALLPWMASACTGCTERVHGYAACSLLHEVALDQLADAKAAFERAGATVCRDRETVASRLARVGDYYGGRGDTAKQRLLLERALALHEQITGPDALGVAKTLVSLGNMYGAAGDAARHRALLERALAIQERHLGADHPALGTTLVSLANACGARGDLARKRALLERALELREPGGQPRPDEPPASGERGLAITLNNLANVYGALGLPAKQAALLTRALALNEQQLGPDHIEVATTLSNLGNAYGAAGNAAQQKALLERALQIRERHYGPVHAKVASTLASLGGAYGALGDPAKQRELLERALDIYETAEANLDADAAGGASSPGSGAADTSAQVVATLFNLGMACRALRDLVAARLYLQQCVGLARALYGPDHATTRRAQAALSRLPVDGDEVLGGERSASAVSLTARLQSRSPYLLAAAGGSSTGSLDGSRRSSVEAGRAAGSDSPVTGRRASSVTGSFVYVQDRMPGRRSCCGIL